MRRLDITSPPGGPTIVTSSSRTALMRIILAEDDALLRDGLTHLLEHRGHHVVAAVADAPPCSPRSPSTGPTSPHSSSPAAATVGYLLKDRVAHVSQFIDALTRLTEGATVLDPEAVSQIMNASRRAATLDTVTGRERQVLGLMAEGRSNTAIATALALSYASVEKLLDAALATPPRVHGR